MEFYACGKLLYAFFGESAECRVLTLLCCDCRSLNFQDTMTIHAIFLCYQKGVIVTPSIALVHSSAAGDAKSIDLAFSRPTVHFQNCLIFCKGQVPGHNSQ